MQRCSHFGKMGLLLNNLHSVIFLPNFAVSIDEALYYVGASMT